MRVNELLAKAPNRKTYNKYYKLHQRYGNVEVDANLLIVENIKRILSGEKLESDLLLTLSLHAENSMTIEQFLKNVRQVTNNHSIYTTIIILSSIKLKLSDIFALKVGEIDNLEQELNIILPDWIKTVLKRQKLLAYNAKLDDNAPFIFCFRIDKSGNYVLVNPRSRFDRFCKDYLYKFGQSPQQHIAKLYFGLENGVMMRQLSSHHSSLIHRYRQYINHLVAVKNYKLKDICDGICIGECEPGVFIVLTADCKFVIAPIYTINMYNEPVYPGRFDKFEKILELFFDYEDFDRSKMKYWSDLPEFYFSMEKYKQWEIQSM